MGTVHGVYLKYVGLSALSYASYSFLRSTGGGSVDGGLTESRLLEVGEVGEDGAGTAASIIRAIPALVMGYSTIVNGAIAVLFKLERGMGIIGKNRKTGQIPLWSHILFFPFHAPTLLYTHIHTRISRYKVKIAKTGDVQWKPVPVATEVQPGWWVGGCYGHELNMDWGGIIDLTVEFNEVSRKRTKHYLSAPTWDGVPATPAQLEHAANFGVMARQEGDVLVHCAHGRGRSTTVMCACLVKAGLFPTWEEAFDRGIKPFRTVCKLNRRMRENLAAWQKEYVDGKKGN